MLFNIFVWLPYLCCGGVTNTILIYRIKDTRNIALKYLRKY